MLFQKRVRQDASFRVGPLPQSDATGLADDEMYPVEYEMMLKGSVAYRNGIPIRQFGVYMDGSVRLVTSGDRVDRETYDALIAAGAIRPPADYVPAFEKDGPAMRIITVTDGEWE
ncbi:MAG: hypothetical protein AMXMBFR4_16580 [Candidatus Hydrogenedentota bacterium]